MSYKSMYSESADRDFGKNMSKMKNLIKQLI